MIYLTPDGILNSVGMRFWKATEACCDILGAGKDDSSYIRSLIDELSSIVSIDQKRIYIVGFSNGAFLAHKVACEHSEKIAAIVAFGGVLENNIEKCQPSKPVNIL